MPRKYSKTTKDSWEKKGERIGGSIGAIASKVKNIISELNVEHKYYDTLQSGVSMLNTGTVVSLCDVAQGATVLNRNGNSIKTKSLLTRLSISLNAAVPTNAICRVIFLRDNQQVVATNPVVATVLQTSDPYSPLNDQYTGRYTILSDKSYQLNIVAKPQINIVKQFHKMDTHLAWSSSAATDIEKHGIYCLFLSNLGANQPTMTMRSRLRFVDN